MNKNYYNNTTSSTKTSFLAGVELVKDARQTYNVSSENWTYPKYIFGETDDEYYAEVWTDGMDWNLVFWLIESIKYNEPKIVPFAIFEEDCLEKISKRTLDEITRLIFRLRRDKFWIKQYNVGHLHDEVLPYLTIDERPHNFYNLAIFEHGSQERVEFLLSKELCKNIIELKTKKYEN